MESLHSHRRPALKYFSAGFTLIELMVVLAIILTITAVVFANQNNFNKTLILANTSYDVALSLRSAETYGLGGHALGALPTGYGIHFDKTTSGSFILFADSDPAPSTSSICHPTTDPTALDAQPGDCVYTAGKDVLVSTYTLGNNIALSDFCAFAAGNWSCAYSHGGNVSTLDVVFARPNADPLMSMNGSYSAVSPVTSLCLTLSSPQGGLHFISIASSGEITANAPSCP